MNKQRLIELVQHPQLHQPADVSDMELLIQQYPYCQVGHVLLAKMLSDSGHMQATKSIRKAALYTSDRQGLKLLIETKHTPSGSVVTASTTLEPEEIHTKEIPLPSSIDVSKNNTFDTSTINKVDIKRTEDVESVPLYRPPASDQADDFIQSLHKRLEELSKLKAKAAGIVDLTNDETPVQNTSPIPEKPVVESDTPTLESVSTKSTAEEKRKNIPQIPSYTAPGSKDDIIDMILGFDNRVKDYFDLSSMTNAAGENINQTTVDNPSVPTTEDVQLPHFTVRDWTIADSRLEESSTDLIGKYLEFLKEEKSKKKRPDKKREQLLLQKFISEDPSIPPMRNKSTENQNIDDEPEDIETGFDVSYATETLAKILIEQGKHPEAIKVYEALQLKYPEKSSYFATIIQTLR